MMFDNGMANWGKFFGQGNSWKRIQGGPGPVIQLGGVLIERTEKHNRDLHYTIAGLIPGRLVALEARAICQGVVNPKGMGIAVWVLFPEPDGGTTVARYFNCLHDVKPDGTWWVSDHDAMQRMLDDYKRFAEAFVPEE